MSSFVARLLNSCRCGACAAMCVPTLYPVNDRELDPRFSLRFPVGTAHFCMTPEACMLLCSGARVHILEFALFVPRGSFAVTDSAYRHRNHGPGPDQKRMPDWPTAVVSSLTCSWLPLEGAPLCCCLGVQGRWGCMIVVCRAQQHLSATSIPTLGSPEMDMTRTPRGLSAQEGACAFLHRDRERERDR